MAIVIVAWDGLSFSRCFQFRLKGDSVTITRVGTNEKYADGWNGIFGGKTTKKATKASPATAEKAVKKNAPAAVAPAAKKSAPAKKTTAKAVAPKTAKKTAAAKPVAAKAKPVAAAKSAVKKAAKKK